jgi:hypothetical protein
MELVKVNRAGRHTRPRFPPNTPLDVPSRRGAVPSGSVGRMVLPIGRATTVERVRARLRDKPIAETAQGTRPTRLARFRCREGRHGRAGLGYRSTRHDPLYFKERG